ncbi:MAG: nucleotidyltransferase domain-containing protein [Nanoarchaeota archaeon]
MEIKLNILKPFFEDPDREFNVRELSRIVKINHTTVRKYLNTLVKEGILQKKKGQVYSNYAIVLSKKYLNLKLYYNFEKIRKSNIIEYSQKEFDFPVIVLFGSYAKAKDTKKSDIDICIISNIKKDLNLKSFQLVLDKSVNIHPFTKKEFENLKKKSPELVNNIANGIVLEGELEII